MPIPDTEKGTVAFLKPPIDSVVRMSELAELAWIIVQKTGPLQRRVGDAIVYRYTGARYWESPSVSSNYR